MHWKRTLGMVLLTLHVGCLALFFLHAENPLVRLFVKNHALWSVTAINAILLSGAGGLYLLLRRRGGK